MTKQEIAERLTHFHRTAPKGAKGNAVWFDVYPRFIGGSPAQVSEAQAVHQALQELDAYESELAGSPEEQAKAQSQGIAHIAQARRETPKGWDILDLCTGERQLRPFA